MKKYLLAAVASAVLGGGAYAADLPIKAARAAPEVLPEISGYLSVYFGATGWDWGYQSDSYDHTKSAFVFGGEGRVNYWWSPQFSVQADLEAEATTSINIYNGTDYDGRVHGVIGAHWAWRNPSSHAVGIFGALSGANNLDYDGQMVHGIIGVEGQVYLQNVTLYGQVGWVGRISGSDEYEPDNLWFIRGVGRYFFTPNDKLQAEGGYAYGDTYDSSGDHNRIINWGALYQHKFGNLPWAVSLEYAGFQHESANCTSYRAIEHIGLIKLTMFLNERTLLFNDRNGATFDQPKFIRALPWSYNVSC